jgi:hypothetical protein
LSLIANNLERERHGIYVIKEGDKVAIPLRMNYESLPPMRYLDEYYRHKIDYLNHDLDNKSEYLKSIMQVRYKQLSRPSKLLINSDEREYYELFP